MKWLHAASQSPPGVIQVSGSTELPNRLDKMLFWHFLKLQKCFMDYETSPDIPAARRWGDDWTFTFRWTAPLI